MKKIIKTADSEGTDETIRKKIAQAYYEEEVKKNIRLLKHAQKSVLSKLASNIKDEKKREECLKIALTQDELTRIHNECQRLFAKPTLAKNTKEYDEINAKLIVYEESEGFRRFLAEAVMKKCMEKAGEELWKTITQSNPNASIYEAFSKAFKSVKYLGFIYQSA